MISSIRIQEQLDKLRTITAPGQGINRLAFSDSDWEGRAYFMELMQKAGLTIRTDAFGNVIGHYAGRDESLPPVLFGSHGDSVPNGGNYDGVIGVLCGIEVLRSMHEDGFIPDHPLEVILFMCEESSRFGAATLGSRAMCGELTADDLERLRDKQGNTLAAVLTSRGLSPEKIEDAKYPRQAKAFLEAHIEQGCVLEHEQLPIGIVTGIAAPTRLRCYLHGKADHSGATPMNLRHDGLCAAAEIILAVEKAAASCTIAPVVGTVGICEVHPGVMNVIPGDVELGIDIRSISAQAKDQVEAAVRDAIAAVAESREITFDLECIGRETPAVMNKDVIDLLDNTAEKLGIAHRQLPSGAGHDSMHWASYAPTGMLFIPCREGISHNPKEFAKTEDIVTAAKIMNEAICTLSSKDFPITE